MVLHAGPGDQLSGTAEPKRPIAGLGERGWCAVVEVVVGAALSSASSHSPISYVPSGLSAKRIGWISMGQGSEKEGKRLEGVK